MIKFECRTKCIANKSFQTTDMTLAWLYQELEQSAEQSYILDLVNVWDRYCAIAQDAQIVIPSSFQTPRSTFKDKLANRLEGIYEFIVLHDQPQNEPCTVLSPFKFQYITVSAMVLLILTNSFLHLNMVIRIHSSQWSM